MQFSAVPTGVVGASRSSAVALGRSLAAVGFPDLPVTPTQVLVAVALVAALTYVWYVAGRNRWYANASERLLYGVPWGTGVTIGVVLAFYLFVQGGFWNWREPLYLPFISWSYFYPTGLLTAGFAHGSAEHLLSNLTATLALAPIAEYAWSHFPPRGPSDSPTDTLADTPTATEYEPSSTTDEKLGDAPSGGRSDAPSDAPSGGRSSGRSGGRSSGPSGGHSSVSLRVGVLDRPWVRAVVVFPAVVLLVSYVTSMLSLGPSLGFSGAVFAIAGFAIVTYPVASVVGILVGSSLGTLYSALTAPVVRGTVESGPPMPPSWVGIAFQAHFLGFLIGVLFGLLVVYATDRRPDPARIFLATLLFGMVQGLWMIVFDGGEEVYLLYRGLGVLVVLFVTVLITAAIAGTATDGPPVLDVLSAASVRRAAAALLVVVTVLIVLPSPFASLGVVDASSDDGSGAADGGVTVEDYTVTYAENATSGYRYPFEEVEDVGSVQRSGVIVVNPDRDIWTLAVRERLLEHDGTANVTVGGVGWRETVDVERSGWDVVGAETAYAVDLTVDGERTRAFHSEPVAAQAQIDGHAFLVEPNGDDFEIAVEHEGDSVDAVAIPAENESARVGEFDVRTERFDDTTTLFVERGETRTPIAEQSDHDGGD